MKSSFVLLKRHILPAVIAFGAAYGLLQTDFAERIENAMLDLRTRWRAEHRPTPPSKDLLLVAIDETSLRQFGHWPWKRSVHGDLVQLVGVVEPTGPAAVGYDVLFPEASPEDKDFVDGIKSSGVDVVLGAERATTAYGIGPDAPAAKSSQLKPLPRVEGDRSRLTGNDAMLLPAGELSQVAAIGFVDSPPGSDGIRREVPLIVRIGRDVYPTLSLQILLRHWHAVPDQVHVKLGEAVTIETPGKLWRIPIDEKGNYYINYRHALDGVTRIGYGNLIAELKKKYVENQPATLPPISNRVLLVGQIANGLTDLGPSPFSSLTPLVLVHANIIENVLAEDYARRVPVIPIWLGGLLVGIVGLAVFSERRLWEQAAFSLGVPLGYGAVSTFAWVNHSVLLPVLGPVLGFISLQGFMIVRRVLAEQRSKEQIKGAFGTYLAPTLVERLAKSGEMPQLGGHEEQITAYFSDIQGYSTFSEKLSAAQLVELLNDYLTVCTDAVTAQEGTLDKYIGDAVVAMFGAPIALPDHAYRACVAALQVQQQLGVLRERWNRESHRWPEGVLKMRSRIGLNSGPAVVGNMGSRTRFNYTMTGDNVNLASRMESGAKQWGVYTMCTEATKLACEKHGADRVVFRPLARIVVMGRSQAVPVFEVVALKETLTTRTQKCLDLFSAALARYYARDWREAIAGFTRSAECEPNQPGKTPGVSDNPSLIYLRETQRCLANPPPPDWSGIHRMTEK